MTNDTPKFRTEGTSAANARVFLQCSTCDADIRELKPKDEIHVGRAYYCLDCDPGVIVLNPPRPKLAE